MRCHWDTGCGVTGTRDVVSLKHEMWCHWDTRSEGAERDASAPSLLMVIAVAHGGQGRADRTELRLHRSHMLLKQGEVPAGLPKERRLALE